MNEKCQVFTPEGYVETLLDCIDYNEEIYGKKILENSSGDGNILLMIVKRYISFCKEIGLNENQIKQGLEKDIYAVEVDYKHYRTCKIKLNQLSQEEGIYDVKWNFYRSDYLKKSFKHKFDFIVSNPPYIKYSELEKADQDFVREHFKTCKDGKFDYCYAFVEKSLRELSDSGRMSYLIPSSIFKTVFGYSLRELVLDSIWKVIDYKTHKVFEDALVSSSILICDNRNNYNHIDYEDVSNNEQLKIDKELLEKQRKWVFTHQINAGEKRFGDYFEVKHSVATLYNEAYIVENWSEDQLGIITDKYYLEKDIVRNAYAPKDINKTRVKKIIFPYFYSNNQMCRYTEEEFATQFPSVSEYLHQYDEKLDNRKKDKSANWFEYGRSQALMHLNRQKIITSTVVSSSVQAKIIGIEDIPYSGIFIYPKNSMTLDDAMDILTSAEFYNYVQSVGIHINGGSVRITTSDILDYCFEEE